MSAAEKVHILTICCKFADFWQKKKKAYLCKKKKTFKNVSQKESMFEQFIWNFADFQWNNNGVMKKKCGLNL